MNKIIILSILISILIILPSSLHSQSRKEVRAVWVTTASRLDFPTTYGVQAQKAEIENIVNICRNANLNTIVFQVSARGDAYYNSNFLPWASNLTCFSPCVDPQNLGFSPGYSPLQEMINKAHQYNIEVHAWVNAFFLISDTLASYMSVLTYPPFPGIIDSSDGKRYWKTRWFAKTINGQMKSDGGFFLDPGNPDVRAHLANVATELVKNYYIDGIHFDFIRYTDLGSAQLIYGDASNYWFTNRTDSANGNPWNLDRQSFARLNIERLIRMVSDSIKKYKPWVKLGTTTPGVYSRSLMGITNCYPWELYSQLCSDPKAWAAKGYLDYHAPQIYWAFSECPEFNLVANWWRNNLSGRQLWLGLAAYRVGEPTFGDFSQIRTQIQYQRVIGAAGVNFFRFRSLYGTPNYFDTLSNSFYKYLANVPPMNWKDPIAPNPPRNLTIQKIAYNRYRLAWSPPITSADGEAVQYYNIFRSIEPIDQNKAEHLYKITANADTFYFDTIDDTSKSYYYAISALDKVDNESGLSNSITTNIEIEYKNIPKTFSLSQNYPNPFNSQTKIDYEIYIESKVKLEIFDQLGRKLFVLLDEEKTPGKYSIEFNVTNYNISSGIYYYKLTSNGASLVKTCMLIK